MKKIAALLMFLGALSIGIYIGTDSEKQIPTVDLPPSPSPVIRPMKFEKPDVKIKVERPELSDISVLYFNTEVNEYSVEVSIEVLHKLSETGRDIYVVIDSPGGSVFSGTKLISHMKALQVNTVCEGICASMGAHMFEAGVRRLMVDKSVLMFHPAAGGLQGTVPEMRSLLNLIDSYTQRMDMETAQRSKIDYDKFKIMVLENLWIEAQDAIAMGLADGYVLVPPVSAGPKSRFVDLKEEIKLRRSKDNITPAPMFIPDKINPLGNFR